MSVLMTKPLIETTCSRGAGSRSRRDRALRGRTRRALLGLAVLLLSAVPLKAQISLETIVPLELRRPVSGLLVGVVYEGQFELLRSFGSPVHPEPDLPADTLVADAVFPFPWGTEMLVGVTARALAEQQMLDLEMPIGGYLTELEGTVLGSATLAHLLGERAGLPDIVPPPGMTWTQLLERAGQLRLVAPPGEAYSRSRLSYPLAARLLERTLGLPINEILTSAVLNPLAMTHSSFSPVTAAADYQLMQGYEPGVEEGSINPVPHALDAAGLPVLYTSLPDLLGFAAAWMSGGLRGADPAQPDPDDGAGMMGPRWYVDGLWYEGTRTPARASLEDLGLGFGVGLSLYPEANAAIAVVANGQVASGVLSWAEAEVEAALTADGAPGDGSDAALPTSGASPVLERTRPDSATLAQLPADLPDWVGTFANGSITLTLELNDAGSPLLVDEQSSIPLVRLDEDVWAIPSPAGPIPLRLTRVGDEPVIFTGGTIYGRFERESTSN